MKTFCHAICAMLLIAGVAACERKGPAERAGERLDDAVDNVRQGESPLKERGPVEKAGKSVDDALGTKKH